MEFNPVLSVCFSFYIFCYSPLEGVDASFKLLIHIEQALIQKPSVQIPEVFNQHGIAEKKKLFTYESFNIDDYIAYVDWKKVHSKEKLSSW